MSKEKEMNEIEVMDFVVNRIMTAHQLSKSIYELQETLSKWILGGAIAIVFAIFNNPKELFEYYNVYFLKVVIISLLVSIFNGLIYVFQHQLDKSLSNSENFKNIIEKNYQAEKEEVPKDDKELDLTLEGVGKMMGDNFASTFIRHLRKSKRLLYQVIFLIIPLIGILIQLVFMHF
jgi:hypothetical protein